jgi:4-diphosphocytidyl-2-C-methyl-D-erythritol kinase
VRNDSQVLRLEGPPEIDSGDDIVVRAAKLLARAGGGEHGADIRVHKRIPIGGGLGGGSSNAATTLVALNHLWKLGFSAAQLTALGLQLGADVPVFVRGIASWGEGVGEQLREVDLPEPWYLVLTPPVQVSTREIFSAPSLKRDWPRITRHDYLEGRSRNVCEPVTRSLYPVVGEALDWLQSQKPARMTGTGASVFAAFDERAQAQEVLRQAPKDWRAFVARGLNRSPLLALPQTV